MLVRHRNERLLLRHMIDIKPVAYGWILLPPRFSHFEYLETRYTSLHAAKRARNRWADDLWWTAWRTMRNTAYTRDLRGCRW